MSKLKLLPRGDHYAVGTKESLAHLTPIPIYPPSYFRVMALLKQKNATPHDHARHDQYNGDKEKRDPKTGRWINGSNGLQSPDAGKSLIEDSYQSRIERLAQKNRGSSKRLYDVGENISYDNIKVILQNLGNESKQPTTGSSSPEKVLSLSNDPDDNKYISSLNKKIKKGEISLERIKYLRSKKATWFNIDANTKPGQYTPVDDISPTAYLYTDGQGNKFYLDRRVNLQDVIDTGRALGKKYIADLLEGHPGRVWRDIVNGFLQNVGHGGRFDIQRDKNTHVQYQKMVPGANYIVGLFGGAVGLPEDQIVLASSLFALKKDQHPWSVISNDKRYWVSGSVDSRLRIKPWLRVKP